jgi:lipoic acid synthetase
MTKNKLNVLPANPEGEASGRFPSWLHRKLPLGGEVFRTEEIVDKFRLNTVCEEAKCPNRWECYTKKTATFLALGKECTRNCGFCDIDFSKTPKAPEKDEPERIALSVKELGLRHAVVTMVARDDLADFGASHIATIIQAIRKENVGVTVEVLTSDFSGDLGALDLVLEARPEIFNHNIETVRRLSPRIRHKAEYDRTLAVLSHAKSKGQSQFVKSGIMIGLGETAEEVEQTIRDLAL